MAGLGEGKIVELWHKRGLKEPTEVQKRAYQPIREGRNVLIIAPTGSGKTEAALIPILAEMLKEDVKPITLLYITPLRALNRDLLERIRWWGEALNFKVDARHGDTSQYRRSKQAEEPPHILITTPETLQAILPAQKIGAHLKNVKYVIIDEIHELAAEKRGYQLAVALERLRERTGMDFQRIGISATVGSPEKVARFLGGVGRTVEIIDVSMKKEYVITVLYPRPTEEDRKEAERIKLPPDVIARVKALKKIVDKHKQVITFVNTRNMAEQLSLYFSAYHDKTDVHHSSLSKDVRLSVEKTFKRGEIEHLIATSSMELGIDVGEVDAVVQYGSPRQVARIIQRVGRSGHRWDRPSIGYIIALDPRDFVEAAVIAKFAERKKIEPLNPEEKPYDVLAHQIAGIVMDWGEIEAERAYNIVKRAHPFEKLTEEEFWDVVAQLESERFIRVRGNRITKSRDTWRYYYSNLSMIPDEEKFFVTDVVSNKRVGVLDEDFVASYLETGTVFVMKGRPWRVISIEGRDVYVEPSASLVGAIPSWLGEMIPVERFVAEEVARERRRIKERMETVGDVASLSDIEHVRKSLGEHVPDDRTVRIERSERYLLIHVPLGTRGNATLSRILAHEINRRYGVPVRVFSSPYAVILEFPTEGFPTEDVLRILETTTPEVVDLILENAVTKTNMFKWRFIHVAKRFGLISKGARTDKINVRRLLDALVGSLIYKEAWKEILNEKLDVEAVKEFLRRFQSGEYRTETGEISKLGKMELSQALNVPELVNPDTPEHTILELFKRRVLEKSVKLLCTSCLSDHVKKVGDLPETIRCPRCGSPLVAVVHDVDEAKKVLKKKKLSKTDERKMLDLIRSAELVKQFGRRAIVAMAVTGVGSQRAARILKTPYASEEEFWKALLDAEREYFRTKMFWKGG